MVAFFMGCLVVLVTKSLAAGGPDESHKSDRFWESGSAAVIT